MAKGPLRDAVGTFNAVNLTTYINSIDIEESAPEIDVTGMGAAYMEIVPGIPDLTITVGFFQDYGVGLVDSTLEALFRAGTAFPIALKTTSAAISTSNPEYQATVRIYTYHPMNGDVGSANQTEVVFRNASATGLVRDVTP